MGEQKNLGAGIGEFENGRRDRARASSRLPNRLSSAG
jgi:hypothetical protein